MKKESKTKKTTTTQSDKTNKSANPLFNIKFLFLILVVIAGIALTIGLFSYLFTGVEDQSNLDALGDRTAAVANTTGKIGAYFGHLLIYSGFGVSALFLCKILIHAGIYGLFGINRTRIKNVIFWDLTSMVLLSLTLGFFGSKNLILGGIVGYEMNLYFVDYIGTVGTILLIIFLVIVFIVFRFKPSPEKIKANLESIKNSVNKTIEKSKKEITDFNIDTPESVPTKSPENSTPVKEEHTENLEKLITDNLIIENATETQSQPESQGETAPKHSFTMDPKAVKPTIEHSSELSLKNKKQEEDSFEGMILDTPNDNFVIEAAKDEEVLEENLAAKLVQDFGEFDPTLELSKYQFPSIDILKEYGNSGITIDQEELEENKNNIVETLKNYKIDIAQIKATVGPTVTLYEIIPEAGVRISKIKNLEDDIALSLAALGIRIIAPIPGRGTIGIEVPNTKPSIVSMKSVIASPKFQNAEMELPVALGKTISNETFVVDLAKMPHLLMAGATGQGKSVGLNALLTSLLYKKHPAEVKFVLVDPKKVELTLFNKIERHYLAKLPDSEDAIITDNTKVINTLNSLCIEMDNRYSLLKDAMVRNIKEYNEKFKQRKLNPEQGHRFLPYIVLVIDEFADLIMTAGKEVETPIARLAQLARAIGIHLIIATQRPSVNVITGIIKANFPARVAFRVTSKIDSRTILDGQGADQLIGRGDMLYTQGNDLVRVQCAFVDTPEVEKLTEYIGSQKAYPSAYLLPEYVGEDGGASNIDVDISERDALFKQAAEVIVIAQQGSASLLQRKLKLGYNRAGRLIDQLEAAGIVGPFEGSKARSVLIPDILALEQFFRAEEENM
ncbi:FtsK/SpoIIIE family DNA translocase [Myroides sp. LoEW2-1]|uniref:FtsK/SpoIIIE family DNA translocase n=1 Tax=Myroides sp. LoEW2-1 TaxID=2683192 RepID=UPI0013214568|nr:DNA translocase FtsK [Myroides sp. LoEW2-1]MVX37206.1 DNA translocase FtsK [Myroides sp. LoEW2-1]